MNTTATKLTIRQQAVVLIPGNQPGKRIGLVVFGESGYYPQTFDSAHASKEEAEQTVAELNAALGIPDDVAEAMLAGSMFGWSVPAAARARLHFGQHPTPPTAAELRAQRAEEGIHLVCATEEEIQEDVAILTPAEAATLATLPTADDAEPEPEDDGSRYRILRFYMNGPSSRVGADLEGLTLAEAQAHCNDPESSSTTCRRRTGIAHTALHGPWFDGYTEE